MSRDIINAVQAPYRHSWSLLTQFIDVCPEKIWNETRGGWPVWQQIAHALAVLNFFTLGENDAPASAPCDMATLMLKVQGPCAIGKDASGRITNKLVGKVFDKYQDVYVNDCKM